ncbi:MAG TPA: SRPBCC family protein [Blastocatellia bacterium]
MTESNTDCIEKSIELKAPIARVWRAISDFREFGQWFGVNLEGPFIPGKTTRGKITTPGYEHLIMQVVVQQMEPERLLSFHWYPTAIDPNVDLSKETPTLVEFKLEATPIGTLLQVTESGFDSIGPKAHELFKRNDAGWAGQMKNIEAYVTNAR